MPDNASAARRLRRIRVVNMFQDRPIEAVASMAGVTPRTVRRYCDEYELDLPDYTHRPPAGEG